MEFLYVVKTGAKGSASLWACGYSVFQHNSLNSFFFPAGHDEVLSEAHVC